MRHVLMLGALAAVGCNLVFDLDSAETNIPAGGAPPAGGSPSAGGAPSGGSGGGDCLPEEHAGNGDELLANGSFESEKQDWSNSGLAEFTIDEEGAFCGCSAARVAAPGAYAELRGRVPDWSAGTVRGRARVRAPNSAALELLLRVDNETVEPPVEFDADDDDGVEDGWRTATSVWEMPAGTDAFFVIIVGEDVPAGTPITIDCASLTQE